MKILKAVHHFHMIRKWPPTVTIGMQRINASLILVSVIYLFTEESKPNSGGTGKVQNDMWGSTEHFGIVSDLISWGKCKYKLFMYILTQYICACIYIYIYIYIYIGLQRYTSVPVHHDILCHDTNIVYWTSYRDIYDTFTYTSTNMGISTAVFN